MASVGNRIWKAIGTNYILFGEVIEEEDKDGWRMLRIKWELPHKDFKINEWQKAVNVSNKVINTQSNNATVFYEEDIENDWHCTKQGELFQTR